MISEKKTLNTAQWTGPSQDVRRHILQVGTSQQKLDFSCQPKFG
jgi:hypothetical protein